MKRAKLSFWHRKLLLISQLISSELAQHPAARNRRGAATYSRSLCSFSFPSEVLCLLLHEIRTPLLPMQPGHAYPALLTEPRTVQPSFNSAQRDPNRSGFPAAAPQHGRGQPRTVVHTSKEPCPTTTFCFSEEPNNVSPASPPVTASRSCIQLLNSILFPDAVTLDKKVLTAPRLLPPVQEHGQSSQSQLLVFLNPKSS